VFLEEPDYGLWIGLPLSEWGIKKTCGPLRMMGLPRGKKSRKMLLYYRNRIDEIVLHALHMKSRRESNTNVWFSFMYSQKCNSSFQNITIICSVSQFLHSYISERFIYFQDRFAYSAAGKYVDRSWEYINCTQTHECGNWD
jgi:hypothetical protein